MKKVLFSLSFICLLAAVSCKSNTTSTESATDKPVSKNTKTVGADNYTVEIPNSWRSLIKDVGNVKMLTITSPLVNGAADVYMNILTEAMQGNSIDDYRTGTIKSILAELPKTTLVDKGNIVADDLKGNWFSYKSEDDDNKIDGINYSIPKDGTAYIISGSTEPGQMVQYRATFDSIAKSLKIK